MPAVIAEIWETFKGRGGSATPEGIAIDRVFRLRVTRNDDGSSPDTQTVGSLLNGLGFVIGAVHPLNPFAVISKIAPKNDKAPEWWLATISYSSLSFDRKHPSDPGLDPLQIWIDEEQYERPALYNREGEAVLTSAGTQLDPPHMVPDTNRILNIKGSTLGTDFPGFEAGFRRSINADEFRIQGTSRVVSERKARMRSIKTSPVEYRGGDGTIPFRPFHIQIELLDDNDPDWDQLDSFLDQSYERRAVQQDVDDGLAAGIGDLIDIKVPGGGEPKHPVLLNGEGQPLPNPTPGSAVFLPAKSYFLKNYAGAIPGCEL